MAKKPKTNPEDDSVQFDFERPEFKVNQDPINVAREADDMIALRHDKAAEMAGLHARLFALHGNEDKARDWMEVKKVIESIASGK